MKSLGLVLYNSCFLGHFQCLFFFFQLSLLTIGLVTCQVTFQVSLVLCGVWLYNWQVSWGHHKLFSAIMDKGMVAWKGEIGSVPDHVRQKHFWMRVSWHPVSVSAWHVRAPLASVLASPEVTLPRTARSGQLFSSVLHHPPVAEGPLSTQPPFIRTI